MENNILQLPAKRLKPIYLRETAITLEGIQSHIEALIFVAEQPISIKDLQECLIRLVGLELGKEEIESHVEALVQKYHDGDYAFEMVPIAGGYQFLTKPAYQPTVSEFLKSKLNKRLSTNSMETLAIIAYRQPISKPDIERIRGVNCDYTIQKLLEKELIAIIGRSEEVGKPLLYGISNFFMNYFGINSVADLPKLRDLEQPTDNVIGSPSDN
ncbi:MAG TPA: SMC-Scp complex subunit ScpB [Chitinophagales bacterium]|nr:SMC-Scp complex subunit ScpB [Chitinophagales bacterium]